MLTLRVTKHNHDLHDTKLASVSTAPSWSCCLSCSLCRPVLNQASSSFSSATGALAIYPKL